MGIRKIWIGELIYRVKNTIQDNIDMDGTKKSFSKKFLREIEEYFIMHNSGYFDTKLCDNLLSESEQAYHCNKITYDKFKLIRLICQYLQEYFSFGTVTNVKLPRLGYKKLCPYFNEIINKYVSVEQSRGVLSLSVIDSRGISNGIFLHFLQGRGHENFETVDLSDIRAFIPFLANRQPRGIINTLPIIRKFCELLNEEKIFCQNWADILKIKLPYSKTAHPPFTNSEIKKLLNAPDKATPIGLRDYAMMLLAAATGIRSIDIINLKLSDIDWRANELSIVQKKTGKLLRLPLLPEAGNAVSDYILKGRPNSRSEHVFVSAKSPHGKLSYDGNNIVQKYMEYVGISRKKGMRQGFHSFRRAIGTRMLEAEVPIELIGQVLGHSSIEATKPYLSIDFVHLKECALDFSEFPCLRGELC